MATQSREKQVRSGRAEGKSPPPSKLKLSNALETLLEDKDFGSITTAEISRTAGVNEALIYRYFGDKRGILHHVLEVYLVDFHNALILEMKPVKGALNKLRVLIRGHIAMYDANRVFAKILLLEVRNSPGYFESNTYELVKMYGRFLTAIINEGVESGEIRRDIPISRIRNMIFGSIEHLCLSPVIFGHPINVDVVKDDICTLLFEGIRTHKA